MKVSIIKDNCIGCGACAAICDEVFEINDEGLAAVKPTATINDETKNDTIDAVESCPTGAIEIIEQ